MFVADSVSMSHMVISLKNMANLREVKTVVKIGNKKTTTSSLWGDWKGYQKRYGKVYPVKCTDTAYIPGLMVNIYSMTRALTKGFNVMPEKVNIVLKKDTTNLKFEVLLDHGNGDGYLLDARLY